MTFCLGPISFCMLAHTFFCIFHDSWWEDKSIINLMAHGCTFLPPFGERNQPVDGEDDDTYLAGLWDTSSCTPTIVRCMADALAVYT